MNPKDTWPVVKFIIEATGFKRQDARKMLEEIPAEKWSRLFQLARAWDQSSAAEASRQLGELLQGDSIETLREATRRAMKPSTEQESDDEETPTRPVKKAKKK